MTKNVAYFLNLRAVDVFDKLCQLKLEIFHPQRKTIEAFSEAGEELFGLSQEAAIQGLESRTLGFTMWFNDSEDFFLYNSGDWIVGSFNGFTSEEENNFMGKLRAIGCNVVVLHEDEEPPGFQGTS